MRSVFHRRIPVRRCDREDLSESKELQLQTKNLDGNFSVSSVSSEDENVVDKIVRVTLRGYKCSKCEFKTTLVDAIETHEKKNSVEFDIMCNLFFLEIKPKSKRDKLTWRAKGVMQLKSAGFMGWVQSHTNAALTRNEPDLPSAVRTVLQSLGMPNAE